MSVNNHKPHVLVLPEDDANRQIVIGFLLNPSIQLRNIQPLPPAGGWGKVLGSFVEDHIKNLIRFKGRHLILLIDFDNHLEERRKYFLENIPENVRDRVFLLGTLSEPEPLRKQCGDSLEEIGKKLAAECYRNETELWGHPLLAHNAAERERLNEKVKSILF